jgi:hypothetical protein
MDPYEKWPNPHTPVMNIQWDREQASHEPNQDDILVLAFERSKTSTLFKKQHTHTNVEIFLVPTPIPTTAELGRNPKSYQFNLPDTLAIYVDKSYGVRSDFKRISRISNETHDTLCIPLTHNEKLQIAHLLHKTKNCKYNAWDSFLSRTIPTVAPLLMASMFGGDNQEEVCGQKITRLHPGQLVTLIIQGCVNDRRLKSKMWGYNSRFTTPHEIYKELAGVCMTINPDAFSHGYVQAWGIGASRTGPDRC